MWRMSDFWSIVVGVWIDIEVRLRQLRELPRHWRWSDLEIGLKSFGLANCTLYEMIRPKGVDYTRLNHIWETLSNDNWSIGWRHLWSSDLSTRAKVFMWHILAQGIFSGSCALRIAHRIGYLRVVVHPIIPIHQHSENDSTYLPYLCTCSPLLEDN